MKNLKPLIVLALTLFLFIHYSYSQFSYEDHILGGMTCVIVQHSVADFDTWYAAYKKDEVRREKVGIIEKSVMRGDANANLITVVFELENLDGAKGFFNDPKGAELMQAAGVTSKPKFTYFKVNNSAIPEGKSFLLVQHTVQDYDHWKQAFDKHESARSDYEISLTALGKDIDNPLNVVAIFNSDDVGNIKSFLEKSDLKEAMKNAGITSKPIQEIMMLNGKG